MYRSNLKRILFTIILLLTMYVANVGAQEPASAQEDERRAFVVDNEIYHQVLDVVFPREVLVNGLGYAFVLRFRPPFDDPESQITILNRAGQIEVVEYRSLDGNILQKLNKIFERTRRQDVAEMAKQIRVEKRVVSIPPAEVAKLRQSFYDHVCQSANYEKKIGENMQEQMALFDGTGYRLWYRGEGESFYDLGGSGVDSPPLKDEHPLVGWMREVRRTLKKFTITDNLKR